MATRRRFGRIRKLPSGRFQARYTTPDGRDHTGSATFATKTAADKYLSRIETDLARGVHVDHRAGRVTVGDGAQEWMSLNAHRLTPKTRESYRSLLDSVILPRWGDVEIGRVTTTGVREWVAECAGKVSASRTRQAHGLLARVLADAVTDGALAVNPAAGVKLPRLPRNELHSLTVEQVETLADAMPAPYHLLTYVMAYGGLRVGEAVALRKGRCELLRKRLHVTESLEEAGGVLHFGDTKTHSSRRVTLPGFLVEALAVHLASLDGGADVLVFTAPNGGPVRYSTFYRRVWQPAVRNAGLDSLGFVVSPHLLRHTCATWLIGQGGSPRDVADHLGHADVAVTLNRYAGAFGGHSEALAERLDNLRRGAALGA